MDTGKCSTYRFKLDVKKKKLSQFFPLFSEFHYKSGDQSDKNRGRGRQHIKSGGLESLLIQCYEYLSVKSLTSDNWLGLSRRVHPRAIIQVIHCQYTQFKLIKKNAVTGRSFWGDGKASLSCGFDS